MPQQGYRGDGWIEHPAVFRREGEGTPEQGVGFLGNDHRVFSRRRVDRGNLGAGII